MPIKTSIIKILIILIAFLTNPALAMAQCAMCKAVAESSGNTQMAQGLNNGIMYLMLIPYLIVGLAAFYIYKNYRNS